MAGRGIIISNSDTVKSQPLKVSHAIDKLHILPSFNKHASPVSYDIPILDFCAAYEACLYVVGQSIRNPIARRKGHLLLC